MKRSNAPAKGRKRTQLASKHGSIQLKFIRELPTVYLIHLVVSCFSVFLSFYVAIFPYLKVSIVGKDKVSGGQERVDDIVYTVSTSGGLYCFLQAAVSEAE